MQEMRTKQKSRREKCFKCITTSDTFISSLYSNGSLQKLKIVIFFQTKIVQNRKLISMQKTKKVVFVMLKRKGSDRK